MHQAPGSHWLDFTGTGGTELTNDRLWRWDPANHALIKP
jgi:hypothetical protein